MSQKLTTQQFLERFNKTETSKYFDVIWDYLDNRKPIKVRCKTCWKEYFYSQAWQLIAYTRKWCPDCAKKNKLYHKNNIDEVNSKIEQRGFICLEYTTARTEATCVCMSCWRKYKKLINNIKSFRPWKKQYKYCLLCNKQTSVWEKIMATVLDNLWIEYFYDSTLPNNNMYRYDFILDKHKIIIEIDWSSHWDRRNFWNNNYSQEDRECMDIEKDELAKEAWYTMVRIKYCNNKLWSFFIEMFEKLNNYININDVKLSLIDLFCLHH